MIQSRRILISALIFVASTLVLFQNCGGVEGGNQLVVPSTGGGGGLSYSARLLSFTTTPATNPTGFELMARITAQSPNEEYQYRVSITKDNGDSVPNCSSTTLRTVNQQMDFSCSSGAVLAAGSYQLLVSGRHPSESRFKTLLTASTVVQSSGGGTTTVTANPPTGLRVNAVNGAPNSLGWTAPNPVLSPAGTAVQTTQYLVTATGPAPSTQTLTVDNVTGTNVALSAFAANGLAAGEYQWSVQTKATTSQSAMPVMSTPAQGTAFTIPPSATQTPTVVEFSAQVTREGTSCRVNGLISGPSIPDTRWIRVLGPNNTRACVRGQSNGSFTMNIPDGGPHVVSMNGMYTDANCTQGEVGITLGPNALSSLSLLCTTTVVSRQVNPPMYPETCIAAPDQSFCPDNFQVLMNISNLPAGHSIGIFTRGPGGPSGNHACFSVQGNHIGSTNNGNGFSWIGVNPGNHITYEARLFNSNDCSNNLRGSLGDRFTVRGGCAGGAVPVNERCP